jgi:hypothetical protein
VEKRNLHQHARDMLYVTVKGPVSLWPVADLSQVIAFNANKPGTPGPKAEEMAMDWFFCGRTRWMDNCVRIISVRFLALLCEGRFPALRKRITVDQVSELLDNFILRLKIKYHQAAGGVIEFVKVALPEAGDLSTVNCFSPEVVTDVSPEVVTDFNVESGESD